MSTTPTRTDLSSLAQASLLLCCLTCASPLLAQEEVPAGAAPEEGALSTPLAEPGEAPAATEPESEGTAPPDEAPRPADQAPAPEAAEDEVTSGESGEPAAPAAPPRSGGPPHCYGQSQAAWVLQDVIGLRMNSLGIANSFYGSYCHPLFSEREGILFALSNVEAGFVNHLAPVYAHLGAFASITPISLLTVGVEISGFYVWPLSLSNSGYLPREGYADSFESSGIVQHPDADAGEAVVDAWGLNVVLNLTARGRIRLADVRHGQLHLLISDTLTFEYWRSGDADYYWNVKVDAILRGSDWMMTNQAVLLLAYPVSERHNLRFGVFDELLYALGWPGLERHQVGGLLGIQVGTLGRRGLIRNFETLLIVSGITNLPIRDLRIPPINVMVKIAIPIPLL